MCKFFFTLIIVKNGEVEIFSISSILAHVLSLSLISLLLVCLKEIDFHGEKYLSKMLKVLFYTVASRFFIFWRGYAFQPPSA